MSGPTCWTPSPPTRPSSPRCWPRNCREPSPNRAYACCPARATSYRAAPAPTTATPASTPPPSASRWRGCWTPTRSCSSSCGAAVNANSSTNCHAGTRPSRRANPAALSSRHRRQLPGRCRVRAPTPARQPPQRSRRTEAQGKDRRSGPERKCVRTQSTAQPQRRWNRLRGRTRRAVCSPVTLWPTGCCRPSRHPCPFRRTPDRPMPSRMPTVSRWTRTPSNSWPPTPRPAPTPT